MKLLYVAGNLGRGGAERELVNQIKALKDTDIYPVVVCPRPNDPLAAEIRALGVDVLDSSAPSRVGRLLRAIEIARHVRPDLVHSQHFYTNLCAWAVGLILRIPGIGYIQSNVYHEIRATGIWRRPAFRFPTWMTANSQAALETAIRLGRRRERTFLLENALDIAGFDRSNRYAEPPWPAGRVVVLAAARLYPQKRLDRFLEAIRLARRSCPQILGVIAGDGELRGELEAHAARLGIVPGGAIFLGQRSDVPCLMKGADIFVLTSDWEGMPNVVQEAMAACLPVVSTKVGAVPDIVIEGKTGYVVEVDDVQGLADHIVSLAMDPVRRKEMGQAGRKRVSTAYSLDRLRVSLERIYHQVMIP